MRLPGLSVREFHPRCFLINDQVYARGRDVVVAADTQSPLAPEYEIRAGTVLVRAEGQDHFVVATDARADWARPASASALQPADAAWANSIVTVSLSRGLGFSVLLDQAAQDNAAVIDQLNRNAGFAGHFLADEDAAGHVRIRSRRSGADAFLLVESSHAPAFGATGVPGVGRDPEVCVADGLGELKDLQGKRVPALVPVLRKGHFDEDQLIGLTPEAKRVLSRQGSLFSSRS